MTSPKLGILLLIASGFACTARNPKFCGDGTCTDPSLPFCDVDGSVDGEAGTCVAVSCQAGTFQACRGDDTLVCNATGDNYDIMHCDTGCKVGITTCNPCRPGDVSCGTNEIDTCGTDGLPHSSQTCDVACVASPAPHCGYLEPKYLPNGCDAVASEAQLVISNSATLSTDLDVNCNGGVVTQNAGPDLCVLRYGTIAVSAGTTLTVTGARALVFLADSSVDIEGTVDVSASISTNGPGGAIGNAGTGETGGNDPRGGGGAGFATAGGSGTGGLVGGPATTNPALLSVLIGGAAGGNRGQLAGQENGKGAGGAFAVIACRGTVTVGGLIDAGGGGGHSDGSIVAQGPGGGGSGGNVVLQGLQVVVTGELYANGGAGGEGNANGTEGQDGLRSTAAAAGGGTGASRGGNGGAKGVAPTAGADPDGAGGGSVGFLQTYTPSGVTPTLTPSGVSPALQANLTVSTR